MPGHTSTVCQNLSSGTKDPLIPGTAKRAPVSPPGPFQEAAEESLIPYHSPRDPYPTTDMAVTEGQEAYKRGKKSKFPHRDSTSGHHNVPSPINVIFNDPSRYAKVGNEPPEPPSSSFVKSRRHYMT